MKKFLSLTILAVLFVSNASAQVERNFIYNCAIGDVHYVEPKPEEAPKNKTRNVVTEVVKGLFELAANEMNEVKDRPEYADAATSGLVSAIGAARRVNVFDINYTPGVTLRDDIKYYVDATISSLKSSKRTRVYTDKQNHSQTAIEYTANVIGEVVIKSVETDQVVWSYTINNSAWNFNWYPNIDEAMGAVIKCMRHNVCVALNNSFPLYASIIDGERFTDKKAKEVYIDISEHSGVYKGMHFFVYSVKEVAGRQAKKKIGQLKVTDCTGEDISLCKVQSGGKEIKEAIEAGVELLITSKD